MSEYILTFQTGEYCLRTASVRRGYSHTLNQLKTLNTFVETFFSPDVFFGSNGKKIAVIAVVDFNSSS